MSAPSLASQSLASQSLVSAPVATFTAPAIAEPQTRRLVRQAAVTVLTGVGAGLGGMALALLLHAIQHIAYGYSEDAVISKISFLQGVTAASPERRVAALTVCGLVAGLGWFAVYRFGAPLISIRKAVASADPRMPLGATTGHALLQIITVALGSPLGREVAPREIGALLAGILSRRAGLDSETSRIMVACGAGAGLAAVYNVPLGGAVFVLEVLLCTVRPAAVIPALASSVIAALVAWTGLGNETQYTVPAMTITPSLVVWSIIAGPLFGYAAVHYTRMTTAMRARAPKKGRIVLWCLVVFAAIGLATVVLPQLPGNGKGPTQLSLNSDIGLPLAAGLLLAKLVATAASLRAGAEGGLLTPGLTIGALIATIIGSLSNLIFPTVPLGAFALVGATAFLSVSMAMPLTAVVLMLEFTRFNQDILIPILFAVGGAIAVRQLANRAG